MRLVIVTGMSGAGKVSALKILEDLGYYCVDNLPIPLLSTFAELMYTQNIEVTKGAIGIDIRNGAGLQDIGRHLERIEQAGYTYEILFMDASDETLIRRYKETRRAHPMTGDGRIEMGIREERRQLAFLKARADYTIDTSRLLIRELRQDLARIFSENRAVASMRVLVLSFGFKHGLPQDADLVFDVRFLPNPYYVDDLRMLTGNDPAVQEYVMNCQQADAFLQKLVDLITFLLPNYVLEGKNQLVIGIGCTGGRHRSVTVANKLYGQIRALSQYSVQLEHRDIR